jgi:hypothetical protein
MGFSIYALYTVDKQPAGTGQDSTISLSFSGLSAGDQDQAPFTPFQASPLSRDIFFGSRRLLVFYIPRLLFGLNQCSEILASFQSNNPGVVKVEMCGSRLVYEEDIEEFVETLVQGMLECPNEYHVSYHQNLLAQVAELQGCDHGKDFSCSFTLQRLIINVHWKPFYYHTCMMTGSYIIYNMSIILAGGLKQRRVGLHPKHS